MIIFLPTLFLISAITALLFAIRLRQDPRLYWMIAVAGAAMAWLSNIYLRFRIPSAVARSVWQINGLKAIETEWVLDSTSWSLSFAFLTFLLLFLLVEVQNFLEITALKWIEILAVMALVSLSAISGNLLTLAFIWITIDIFSAIDGLRRSKRLKSQSYVQFSFTKNILTVFLLLWVSIAQQNEWLSSQGETLNSILLLILGIRFGLIMFDRKKYPQFSGFLNSDNYLRLVSLFPGFVLMAHIEKISAFPAQVIFWAVMVTILLPAIRWISSKDFVEAYPNYLVISIGLSFIFIAQAFSAAAVSLLIVTLILVLLIPLMSQFVPYRIGMTAFILWTYSALPFSPLKAVSILYQQGPFTLIIAFTIIQIFILSGWQLLIKNLKLSAFQFEKWQRNIYGTILLICVGVFIFLSFDFLPFSTAEKTNFSYWPLLAVGLSIAISYASPTKLIRLLAQPTKILGSRFPLNVGYSLWSRISNIFTKFLHLFSSLLEGNAGVLWAMLLILLMLSLVGRIGVSG